MTVSWQELLVLLVVAMAAFGFGSTRVPQVGKTLGQGVNAFKREATAPLDPDPPAPPLGLPASGTSTGTIGSAETARPARPAVPGFRPEDV